MADVIIRIKAEDEATRELNKVDNNLGRFGGDLDDMVKLALKGTAVVAGFGLAAKKAFDLGAEGAQIIQTGESFDLLLEKIGATPDLLNQLRKSSRGTVDDMTLMSSTSTLLAGAQGELATSLANSTPQLLEIAKAANKLNPSLGDTTFLYQSLATGIKRSSPLILDNLGLTIKIGEANETMAKSLGKSVNELTAQEKQMALLNATLKAGDVLIDQVGGDVDSATDEFAKFTANIKNSADKLKRDFSPAVATAIKQVNTHLEKQTLLDEAIQLGIRTQAELYTQIRFGRIDYEKLSDEVERYKLLQENAIPAAESFDKTLRMANKTIQLASTQIDGWNNELSNISAVTDDAGQATSAYSDRLQGLADAFDESSASTKFWRNELDLVTGALHGLGLEGEKLRRAEIALQLATGELTLAEADQLNKLEDLKNAFVAGEITLEDYIGTIKDSQITQEEYTSLVNVSTNALDEFETTMISAKQGVEKFGSTIGNISPQIEDYIALLARIPQNISTSLSVKIRRAVETENFQFQGTKGNKAFGQFGLSNFIVPPGFPNDSFPIFASSGERVNVETPTQQKGGRLHSNIYQTFNVTITNESAAKVFLGEARRLRYARLNESM